jgi:hypothetical protein
MRPAFALFATALLFAAGGPAASAGPDPSAVRAQLALLRDGFEAPGRTVEEVAHVLKTPQRALAFVREEVAWFPYRGSWHDAQATLRLRVANAVDKAVLLAALLRALGQETRLVSAPWPQDAKPHQTAPHRRPTSQIDGLRTLLGTPAAPPPADDLGRLREEVGASLATLRAALVKADLGARLEGTPSALAAAGASPRWVWVQARAGSGTWRNLDPTFPGHPRPAAGVQPFAARPAQVSLRVLRGKSELLAWKANAAELLAHDACLLLVPAGGQPGAAGTPEKVASWRPLLQVGATRVSGKAFSPKGKATAPPAPSFNPFGGGRPKPAASGGPLLLELAFEAPGAGTWKLGREWMRFDKGFDPQQLVALTHVGASVGLVPFEVTAARQVDELLDLDDLRHGKDVSDKATRRSRRGPSARTARVVDALSVLQPALLADGPALAWTGPTVAVESVSLASQGAEKPLSAVARLDLWHQALQPAAGSTRLQRAAWGLATLAVEGWLMRAPSVNARLGAEPAALRVLRGTGDLEAVKGDPMAAEALGRDGVVLVSPRAPGLAWSLGPDGTLRGTLRTRGSVAKGGESRSQVAGRGFGALGGAALGALGAPSGMLVGAIAAYLGELAKAYGGAANVLDALGRTEETGDPKHVLEAIGQYRGDIADRLTHALAAGALRGWAESLLGAGLGASLPAAGSALGGRLRDGALAGALAYPKDLPVVSGLVAASIDALSH